MSILRTIGTTTAVGLLFMDGDASQEDGLAVEQELLAAGLDGAEANGVGNHIAGIGVSGAESQADAVALGNLWRPEL